LDLKIAARMVADRVSEPANIFGQFMIIHILHVLAGTEHVVVLQRLPTAFSGVEAGVEHDAMGVQMRVQRPGGVMSELRGHDVLCTPVITSSLSAEAHRGKLLKFLQRDLYGTMMRLDQP